MAMAAMDAASILDRDDMSPTAQSKLRRDFLDAMSHVPSTVYVVTTDGPAGRYGMTVSALSSVTAETERPTLLICVNRTCSSAYALLHNAVFCVNVLRDTQRVLAERFAGQHGADTMEKRFASADWVATDTGAPRMIGALAAFDCRIASRKDIGTHHVLFGEVMNTHLDGGGLPLVYARRSYQTIQTNT